MFRTTVSTRIAIILMFYMLILVFAGCSKFDTDVSIVKNGVLDIDKSLTVGQAFSSYKYFKNKTWKATKDIQGRRFVTFKGVFDTDLIEVQTQLDKQGIKSVTFEFQFLINADNTIVEGNHHWETVKLDGAKGVFESGPADGMLSEIYRNQLI
ncbi:MAG: hypothetical protein FPO08_04405 [Geobacter sp.]|nr:MAG: hypothetical protein FPO08_04405 [Geobacter sp.]